MHGNWERESALTRRAKHADAGGGFRARRDREPCARKPPLARPPRPVLRPALRVSPEAGEPSKEAVRAPKTRPVRSLALRSAYRDCERASGPSDRATHLALPYPRSSIG